MAILQVNHHCTDLSCRRLETTKIQRCGIGECNKNRNMNIQTKIDHCGICVRDYNLSVLFNEHNALRSLIFGYTKSIY